MRSFLLILLLLTPLSSAFAAATGSWSTPFSATTVATWLDSPSARYLLVPAGTKTLSLAQAEQALAAALRGSGKATLVMDAQALGAVAQKDDASIIQRGATLPVDRILVLRLFPEASGAWTQAVVAIYDPVGGSHGSFSATLGMALAPGPHPSGPAVAAAPESSPATPESSPAPPAPAPPSVRPSPPGLSPQEQYEQQYIGFDELVAVHTGRTNWVTQLTVPYEGKFKKPLEGEAFYKKLGREDLVSAYQSKRVLKTVLGIAGGVAMVGGALYGYQQLHGEQEDCARYNDYISSGACFDRNSARDGEQRAGFATGLGIVAAGIGLLAVGIFIDPHPVDSSEARVLADGYNQKLKSDLGLTPAQSSPPTPSFQTRFSPVFHAHGGGLLLSGTF